MKGILARGGASATIKKPIFSSSLKELVIVVESVKDPVLNLDINPHRTQFTNDSKIIIENMFKEHTASRFLQGSAQKIKTVTPNYLAPVASASIKINVPTTVLVGWTSVCVALICLTVFGSLHFFQRAEHIRFQNQHDEVVSITE